MFKRFLSLTLNKIENMMRSFIHLMLSVVLIVFLAQAHAADFKEFEQELSDSVISAKITAKYAKNQDLNPLKIYVSTQDGTVTLSGHVKDKEAFVNALRIAKATRGVKRVEADDLSIKDVNTAFTDAYITTKVEAAVLKAKVLDDESIPLVGINATTQNGVVTLSGDLKKDESIQAILKRVEAVHGVKKVISHLKVIKATS